MSNELLPKRNLLWTRTLTYESCVGPIQFYTAKNAFFVETCNQVDNDPLPSTIVKVSETYLITDLLKLSETDAIFAKESEEMVEYCDQFLSKGGALWRFPWNHLALLAYVSDHEYELNANQILINQYLTTEKAMAALSSKKDGQYPSIPLSCLAQDLLGKDLTALLCTGEYKEVFSLLAGRNFLPIGNTILIQKNIYSKNDILAENHEEILRKSILRMYTPKAMDEILLGTFN